MFINTIITIDVVKGGFLLQYSTKDKSNDSDESWYTQREVFSSQRKLMQKLKEIISDLSLVGNDE